MGVETGAMVAAEGAKTVGEAALVDTAVGSSMVEVGAVSVADFAAMDAAIDIGIEGAVEAGVGGLTASDMALAPGIEGAVESGFGASASDLAALNGVEYTGAGTAAGGGLSSLDYGGTEAGAGGLGGEGALNGYDVAWSSTPQESLSGSEVGVGEGATDAGVSSSDVGAESFNAAKDSQLANEAGVGMDQPMPAWMQQIKNGYDGLKETLKPLKPYYNAYQAGSGLYDMYAANQKAGALREQTSALANMYQPGTPEYELQMKQLAARDAAAGRRSQYGPRANELAGIMAKNRSNVMTSPGYTAMLNGQLNNQYAGAGKAAAGLSGLFL